MKRGPLLTLGLLFAIAFASITECESPQFFNSTAYSQSATTPSKFTIADLRKLKWIEGTWRGTGDVEHPFFERYRFEDNSTLAVDSFADGSLSKITDTTRYELKDGEFGGGDEGFRWVATSIDATSITFSPVAKARNSFRWQRESKDGWKAILNWPATADKPARERTYQMTRWPAPIK